MKTFLNGKVTLHAGDSREVLMALPDASIDSVVCDPPYGLGFMGRHWDAADGAPFAVEFWAEVLRVLKPGGHVVAFSGTRTYHRMACAIEDAGFEIRDQIGWVYGSGFPKSHDVSKAIDKAVGVERKKVAVGAPVKRMIPGADQNGNGSWIKDNGRIYQPGVEIPATEEAAQWEGWGTALKPAWEPICLARKPLSGTVAECVLEHGTGALNIGGCRVEAEGRPLRELDAKATDSNVYVGRTGSGGLGKGLDGGSKAVGTTNLGRWPANLVHDGSKEVLDAFPDVHGAGAARDGSSAVVSDNYEASAYMLGANRNMRRLGDEGSAARFFYTAKADAEDRLGSKHPTVKPLDLMQWLVRLVTPKGGTVLDPFAGTGTTGEAAWREGMRAVLIEREAEYQADIARRMELAAQPTKRAAVAKTKNKLDNPEDLPLFAAGTP